MIKLTKILNEITINSPNQLFSKFYKIGYDICVDIPKLKLKNISCDESDEEEGINLSFRDTPEYEEKSTKHLEELFGKNWESEIQNDVSDPRLAKVDYLVQDDITQKVSFFLTNNNIKNKIISRYDDDYVYDEYKTLVVVVFDHEFYKNYLKFHANP
jgi:hypothetical protein